MYNFIKLTEIQFSDKSSTNPKYFEDYIRPSELIFMEVMKQNGFNVTKIHFAIGTNKCSVTVKETPEEIDKIIDEFFKGKKQKKSPSKKGAVS